MRRDEKSARTRDALLGAAFDRVHHQGFQAAGLSDILSETGLTKGAFYHHFPTKAALGYALLEGPVQSYLDSWWLEPLDGADDPLEALATVIRRRMENGLGDMVRVGCPLTNLMAEMPYADHGFQERLENLLRHWRKGLAKALRAGQQRGRVNHAIDAEEAAAFIVAVLQGAFVAAKAAQNIDAFRDCLGGLGAYLTSLRA